MSRRTDDDCPPSYWDSVRILTREIIYRHGPGAGEIGPDCLWNYPDVVAIFPPDEGDTVRNNRLKREEPAQCDTNTRPTTQISTVDRTTRTMPADNRDRAPSCPPSETSSVTNATLTSARPFPSAPVDPSFCVRNQQSDILLVDFPANSSADGTPNDRRQELTRHKCDNDSLSPNNVSHQGLGPGVSEIPRTFGAYSGQQSIRTTESEALQELSFLLPVHVTQDVFTVRPDATQTNIQWTPPANVGSFSQVMYKVQIAKIPPNFLEYEHWEDAYECSTPQLRVYRVGDKVIIGRIQLTKPEPVYIVRIRADGLPLGKRFTERSVEGQWSNIFKIRVLS